MATGGERERDRERKEREREGAVAFLRATGSHSPTSNEGASRSRSVQIQVRSGRVATLFDTFKDLLGTPKRRDQGHPDTTTQTNASSETCLHRSKQESATCKSFTAEVSRNWTVA